MQTDVLETDRPEALHEAVRRAVDFLARGEVVALPTETVYGLAGDATNAEAVSKIFAAKDRPAFDPLIVHLPHKDRLAEVAQISPDIAPIVPRLTEKFWPGPLTLVLPKTGAIPDIVTSGLPTVAVRMSAHPVFRRIITSLGKPLAAPSANCFGRISPTSANAVVKELSGRIPLVVDGGACSFGLESTIIRIEPTAGKPLLHVLRAGPITKEELQPFGKVVYAFKDRLSAPEVPGQLASHYAPRTPLHLLESPADFHPAADKRYALLSFRGDEEDGYLDLAEWEQVLVLSPGSGKLPEAAVRLFYCLRQLDELGVDEIIAEPVREIGLGIAIMDRLRRASSMAASDSIRPAAEVPASPASATDAPAT